MIRVFGSLNMDLVATVATLPRPGETVLAADYATLPGGKGNNQAIAAARAGGRVAMAGCVGIDEFGDRLIENLRGEGIDTDGVHRVAKPTGIAMITVDAAGENVITVASGANLSVTARQLDKVSRVPSDTLVVQMETPPDITWEVVAGARRSGMRTVVNVAPALSVPKAALAWIDVLVVNEGEATAVARGLGLPVVDTSSTARALVDAGVGACVVTLGGDGVLAVANGTETRIPPAEVTVVDTTGAGDTFTGVLAQGLDCGLDLATALRRASVAAGLACEGLGAQASMPSATAIDVAMAEGRI